jgi:hypothetical protein
MSIGELVRLPTPSHGRSLSGITWVETSLDAVVGYFRSWQQVIAVRPGPRTFDELVQESQPWSAGLRDILLPNENWVGVINRSGETPHRIAGELAARTAYFVWMTTENSYPGGCVFSFYDRTFDGTRDVRATRDGRWVFGEGGDPLPFEDLESYRAKRIADRLTPRHLERYAIALGIPVEIDLGTSVIVETLFTPSVDLNG